MQLLTGIDTTTGNKIAVAASSLGGSAPYDIYLQGVGIPQQGVLFINAPIARALTLPANLTGSLAVAGVAPTANVYLAIQKNGTAIGNLNFTAGSTVGTFVFTDAVTFAAGDVLSIFNPNAADATLANLGVTFVATLS